MISGEIRIFDAYNIELSCAAVPDLAKPPDRLPIGLLRTNAHFRRQLQRFVMLPFSRYQ